jgi:hypothetical protein
MPTLLRTEIIRTPEYRFNHRNLSGWIKVRVFPKNSSVQWNIGSLDDFNKTSHPLNVSDGNGIDEHKAQYFWALCGEFMAPGWPRGFYSFRWGRIKVPTESLDTFLNAFKPFWLGTIDEKMKEVLK